MVALLLSCPLHSLGASSPIVWLTRWVGDMGCLGSLLLLQSTCFGLCEVGSALETTHHKLHCLSSGG